MLDNKPSVWLSKGFKNFTFADAVSKVTYDFNSGDKRIKNQMFYMMVGAIPDAKLIIKDNN